MRMRQYSTLMPLLESGAVVLGVDAYGVVYNELGCFESVKPVIDYCNLHDIPVVMMTNNATQSIVEISNKLHEFDIAIAPEYVISSGCGCYELPDIRSRLEGEKVFVYGYPGSKYYPDKAGALIVDSVTDADCIVMAASLGSVNHRVYYECFNALQQRDDMDVICINPDHYVRYGHGYYRVMGYYAHQLEIQLNRHWIWMGKPYSL